MLQFLKLVLVGKLRRQYLIVSLVRIINSCLEFMVIYTVVPLVVGESKSAMFSSSFFFRMKEKVVGISENNSFYLFIFFGITYILTHYLSSRLGISLYRSIINYYRQEILSHLDESNYRKSHHSMMVYAEKVADGTLKTIELCPLLTMTILTIATSMTFSIVLVFSISTLLVLSLATHAFLLAKIKKSTKKYVLESSRLNTLTDQFFREFVAFELNHLAEICQRKLRKVFFSLSESYWKIENDRSLSSLGFEVLGFSFVVFFFYLAKGGHVPLGEAIFIPLVFYRLAPGVIQFQSKYTKIKISFKALVEIKSLSTNKQSHPSVKTKIHDKGISISPGKIDLGYIKLELEQLIEINRGDIILVQGASGVGKTTLMKALARQLIDVGYMSERAAFFGENIKENIIVGNTVDLSRYQRVVRYCKLANIIDQKGEESVSNLSAGEAQRVGLARILYQNRSHYILDESLSQLDELNEEQILKNLRPLMREKIFFYISHRNGLRTFFDKKITIVKGKIIFEKTN